MVRRPTTVTAKQKVTAKQRKRVSQRLLSEKVRRVTVTHCSLEKPSCFELTMFCTACGSVGDGDANFCKAVVEVRFLI